MRVLITGANGYIGKHVVKSVLDAGASVIACDFRTEEIDDRAEIINLDLFSLGAEAFSDLKKPDVCVHLAWQDGFSHNSDNHMINLSKHYMFIMNMLNGGLKQLAVMGSMHEVGYHEGPVTESTPCNPISMYGVAKDSLRRSTFLFANGRDASVQWLRGYYVYGDDLRNQSIFSKLIQAEKNGKKTFPLNSGKNKYDFIHINSLAEQIAAVATQCNESGIINCCSGIPQSLGEKVEAFIKEHGMNIRLEYGVFPDRPYDSPAIWGDNCRIKKIMRK